MGLIDNTKTSVALPIVAYFATSLFYRGGLTLRQGVAGGLGFALMAALVSPMIHAYRTLGIRDMPWQERVTFTVRAMQDASKNGGLQRYEELAVLQLRSGYYNYFGEGKGQMLLGRYASIEQIDPVIATTARQGMLGGTVIWPSFTRLLPSFVYPDKPHYVESYRLLVQLGLIRPEGGKYPTVPLVAQSYAGYGPAGLLLIPFLTFLGFLLALKKLGWKLYRNVFAIFFFCMFTVVYANQGDLGQYAGSVLRNFPIVAAILWLLVCVYRLRVRYSVFYPRLTSRALSPRPPCPRGGAPSGAAVEPARAYHRASNRGPPHAHSNQGSAECRRLLGDDDRATAHPRHRCGGTARAAPVHPGVDAPVQSRPRDLQPSRPTDPRRREPRLL
jgi:hypothetical protein